MKIPADVHHLFRTKNFVESLGPNVVSEAAAIAEQQQLERIWKRQIADARRPPSPKYDLGSVEASFGGWGLMTFVRAVQHPKRFDPSRKNATATDHPEEVALRINGLMRALSNDGGWSDPSLCGPDRPTEV